MTEQATGQPVLVAVDFTADTLRLLMTDLDGREVMRERWPLDDLPDEAAWSWEVGGRIASTFAKEGQRRSALGIGVACPGTVDPVSGVLLHSTARAEWDGLSVVHAIRRHIDAPVAAVNRCHAALDVEVSSGAAEDAEDVLYVSLRGIPQAAAMVAGRMLRGASHEAGALPALADIEPNAPLTEEAQESIASVLADATALLNPQVVVLEGESEHLDVLVPLLQSVLDEVAPGPQVVRARFEDDGALLGAVRVASIVSYEGERDA